MAVRVENELVFKASLKKALLILVISIGFVVLGAWMTTEKPVLGWICVGFFGLGIPASLVMMRPNTTHLKLDQEGFEIKAMWRSSRIKWTEVENFHIARLHGNKMIAIEFNSTYTKQRTGRAVASALSGMESAIADHYNAPVEEILQTLNAWRERFGQKTI